MLLGAIKSTLRRQILPRGNRHARFDAEAPLIVAGTFRTSNGIGRAAIGCYLALQELGLSPIAVDLSQGFNQVDQHSPIPLHPPQAAKRGTAIIYANPPELERALMLLKMRRWHNWRIIGAWVWELPVAPEEWRPQVDLVSEIWAPSSFVQNAFESAYTAPVKRVPHFLKLQQTESIAHTEPISKKQPFEVLVLADGRSSFYRKNILAAIDVFKRAFSSNEPAQLTIKTRNLSLFAEFEKRLRQETDTDSRIKILDQSLAYPDLLSLIAKNHVLLSAHRAEGFGITLAEAMSLGTIAVATNWSGNTDFMNENNSVLLPYSLIQVIDPSQVYERNSARWADVDIDEAAGLLRRLWQSTDLRNSLSEKAKADVLSALSARNYGDALGINDDSNPT